MVGVVITLDSKEETENQWLTVSSVALVWTGTLNIMYLRYSGTL